MPSKVYVWKFTIWQIQNLKIDNKNYNLSDILNHVSGKKDDKKNSGWAKNNSYYIL